MAMGRMKYVPPIIIDELEAIKASHQLQVEVEAFRKMAQYSQLGREVERLKRGKRFL